MTEPPMPSSDRRVPWLLFIGSALLGLFGLFFFEGDVIDATSRTLESVNWLEDPLRRIGTHFWGDGNYLLPAVVIAIGGDLFYSVRILYVLVGAATIPVLYRLTEALFDRRAALWAAVLFALNPFRLAFSMHGATGEIPYLLLSFLGLLIVVRIRRQPTVAGAALAGLCFTLGAAFRFEAGWWAMVSALILLVPPEHRYRPRLDGPRIRAFIAFCLVGISYPLLLVFRWWQLYGDPAYYFTLQSVNQGQFYASGQNPNWPDSIYIPFSATFWVTGAIAILTPMVALPGFTGLLRALGRQSRSALVAAGVVGMTLLFSIQSVRTRFPLEYRYALVLHGLICMFVVYGWQWLGERFAVLSRPRVQIAAMAVSVLVCYAGYSVAAFTDTGVAGRRLGILTPVRPGQYETRAFFTWFEREMPGKKVLMSPCVRATYAVLRRRDLISAGRLRLFSEYRDDIHVYNRKDFEAAYAAAARDYDVIVFNRRCAGLGLIDGRIDDPFLPPAGQARSAQGGVTLVYVRDIGALAVYQIE